MSWESLCKVSNERKDQSDGVIARGILYLGCALQEVEDGLEIHAKLLKEPCILRRHQNYYVLVNDCLAKLLQEF